MLAWYFAPDDRKLRYGDSRKVRQGVAHKVEGPLALCKRGLHASISLRDALSYAPGSVLCRVRLSGAVVKGKDKACATERTYLRVAKADKALAEFARKCALRVVHLWKAPEVVVRYLKTGDESIRAAAYAAAYAAVRDAAARDARAAARAAAHAAARAAARAADARDAAAYAAYAAADAAEREWQERALRRMAAKLFKETA